MKAEYPRLAQMALDILTIPATEADCERAFSQAADLLEPRRSNLSYDAGCYLLRVFLADRRL
jgi:hypothetical protein